MDLLQTVLRIDERALLWKERKDLLVYISFPPGVLDLCPSPIHYQSLNHHSRSFCLPLKSISPIT